MRYSPYPADSSPTSLIQPRSLPVDHFLEMESALPLAISGLNSSPSFKPVPVHLQTAAHRTATTGPFLSMSSPGDAGSSAPAKPTAEAPSPARATASSSSPAEAPKWSLARSFPRLGAFQQRVRQGRVGRSGAFMWRNRRGFLIGFGLTYTAVAYSIAARDR